jgi:hypothetical protein
VGDGELASHAHGKLLPRKGRSLKTALGYSKSLKTVQDSINLVKHTSTPQRLKHSCAHRSKKQMAALFSSSISRRKSRDASKIFRAMRLQTLAER